MRIVITRPVASCCFALVSGNVSAATAEGTVGSRRGPQRRIIMRCMVVLLTAAACFGQGIANVAQTGTIVPPQATFASPPSSPVTGAEWTFRDASTAGTCSGGGSAIAKCRWSGSAWQAVGGGGGSSSQASIFSGGTQVQGYVQCAHSTVSYTALTAAASSQEITIQTGISGNARWDQIMVSETTQFAGATGLTVSIGRPGTNNMEMTGAQ